MSGLPLGRRLIALIQVTSLLAAVLTISPAAATPIESPDADGLVVIWRADVARTGAATDELHRRGLRVRRSLLDGRATVVEAGSRSVLALAEELSRMPGVVSVEPDYHVRVTWEPNDHYYASGAQWAYSRIQGPAAWDVTRGADTVLVAVVDTGADLSHPDLAGRLDTVNDRNFMVAPGDAGYDVAADDNGHGTHVAGIVAATTDNTIGVAGTAPQVRVLPLKVMSAAGVGDSSAVAAAIEHATSVGADVINLSLAFNFGLTSTLVEQAIHDATAAGVIVVAAAGNSGSAGVRYPAAYPECIAVGASGRTDERASYSTYGVELDIMAPGGTSAYAEDMIMSTFPQSMGSYSYMQGTSMATPFVSGTVALLRSFAPSATAFEIRSAIESSAKDVAGAGFDAYTGHGLLQMRNALDYLAGIDTTAPTTASDLKAAYDDVATVALTADDGVGLGVAATYYAIDGGALQRGTTVTVTGYGDHTLDYWSDDLVGNEELANSATLFIDDTIPPTTTSNAVAIYDSVATIVLRATDGLGSGVFTTTYQVDGGPARSGTVAVVSEMGTHTLSFASTDVRGNTEATRTVEFVVRGVPDVSRVYGATRYGTAVGLTRGTYPDGSGSLVVMASGENYPDALSASGLSGVLGAPLLLTGATYLPAEIADELRRLGTRRVIVVGGVAAVSSAVERTLTSMGIVVEREQGRDRYATAAAVARRIAAESAAGSPTVAFVVRADMFPDALAVSSLAAAGGLPVLLTSSNSLSPACASAIVELGVGEVVIAGAESAISAGTAASVAALPGVTVVRRGGPNRYDTAASVVRYGLERGWVLPGFMGVATGTNFPDALVGGVVAAEHGGVALLSDPRSLSAPTATLVREYGSDHLPIWVYGGPGAIAETVKTTLAAMRF